MPIHNQASQKHIAKKTFLHECILIIHWDDYLRFSFVHQFTCSVSRLQFCRFVFFISDAMFVVFWRASFFPTLNCQPFGSAASSRQFWQTGSTLWLDLVFGLNLVLLRCLCRFFFSRLCFCSKKLKLVATRCFENGAMSGITLSMKKNAGHFWKMLSYMNCVNMKKQTKKVKQRKQGERTTQQRFKLVK